MFKKLKLRRYWKKRVKGKRFVDWEKGPGYYIDKMFIKRPYTEHVPLQSGRTGIYELVDADFYGNPGDMVKRSTWCFLGYKDQAAYRRLLF